MDIAISGKDSAIFSEPGNMTDGAFLTNIILASINNRLADLVEIQKGIYQLALKEYFFDEEDEEIEDKTNSVLRHAKSNHVDITYFGKNEDNPEGFISFESNDIREVDV